MYREFFGLTERPFDLTADPRFLFLSHGHREALSLLHYGMIGDKGVTVLIGEAGTGKTTLLRAALSHHQDSEVLCLYLNNPTLTRQEFYEFLAYGIRLRPGVAGSKTVFLRELERALSERREAGALTVLVVDEAQAIPAEMLEEIRMLANLETSTAKLLSVVLTGQPELAAHLNEPALRPLKQRVALRTTLPAFALQESASYVAKRVRVAGGDASAIFTREAVELIHQASRGIPRTISVIGDNALMTAFALRSKPVSGEIVAEVCRDLDLDLGTVQPQPAAAPPPKRTETPEPPKVQPLQPLPDTVPVQLLGTPRPLSVVRRMEDSGERLRAVHTESNESASVRSGRHAVLSSSE